MEHMISLLTDKELIQAINDYEMLKTGSLPEGAYLRQIAGDNIIDMIMSGLSCYRELYLRSQKNA